MRSRPLLAMAIVLAASRPLTSAADPLVYPDQTVPDSATLSPITAAFVAAVGPFNGFLRAADGLAAERAGRRLRAFAGREALTRDAVLDELRAWSQGIARGRFAEAHSPTIDRLGPLFGAFGGQIDIAAVPADLQQRRDLLELERLADGSFDAVFARAQVATLRQLENTYVDYIKNGDDQVLRALSVRDLGTVRALLARLPGA